MVKVIIPDSQDSEAPGPGNIISSPTNDPPSQLDDMSMPSSQASYLDLQESYIKSPPRVASVTVVYCLFLQVLPLLADGGRSNGSSSEWRLLETDPNDPALDIDLQGITWRKCQQDVLNHITKDHATLKDYLNSDSARAMTNWFGSIEGDEKYGAHETGGVLILNHPHFLEFAARAYNATPHDIKISVIMDAPVNPSKVTRLATIREIRRGGLTPSEKERVTAGISEELGQSAMHPIEVDSIASGTTQNGNMFVTPPNHARSYTLRPPATNPRSFPDCEFLDCCTGRTIAAYRTLDHLGNEFTNENISLERFMKFAHIPPSDELTQSLMIVNGIAHWSFFLTATEAQLTTKGFPLGTARLLCNAAAKIGPIVNENGTSEFSSLQLGVGYHRADMEAYLRTCHVPSKDHVTRAQLKLHGITHWTFFVKSCEAKLLKLGFPLGTSRLLCDSVSAMQAKQQALNRYA
ncbi:hypothetical protein PCASD_21026 [Puccinia coronata f. sp. avenae]|uniref:Uncharacterized protein n=2 Tax=Puccinia coronata f. sp. avenae TaxID=200324 RepID=A0A2N5S875_9BASI|nr:hypothetical protein PCASD_21026 [Puccinia coronata f. sp. avenae]